MKIEKYLTENDVGTNRGDADAEIDCLALIKYKDQIIKCCGECVSYGPERRSSYGYCTNNQNLNLVEKYGIYTIHVESNGVCPRFRD